jgi:hypothetical protein
MKAVGPSGAAHNLRAEHADRLCYGGTGEESRHGATHFQCPNLESNGVVVGSCLVACWAAMGLQSRAPGVGSRESMSTSTSTSGQQQARQRPKDNQGQPLLNVFQAQASVAADTNGERESGKT